MKTLKQVLFAMVLVMCLAVVTTTQAKAANDGKEKTITMLTGEKKSVSDIVKLEEKNLQYASSNTTVASVSKNGKITALNLGSTKVTVTSKGKLLATITVKVTLASPTNVVVQGRSTGNAELKLSWNGVSGADKYIVYRKIRGSKWKKVSTVSKTSYVDKDTQGGKTHYYRVVAIKDKLNASRSKASAIATIQIPHKPYGPKINSIDDNGICYYWKKLDKITGYEIWRCYTIDGTYELVAHIEDPTVGWYYDKTYDPKKTSVYYKCRSFAPDESGKLVYSKFSKVKRADARKDLLLQRELLYLRSGDVRTIGAYQGWGDAKKVTWTSSKPKVASVDQKGTITGLSKGTTTVSCYSAVTKQTKKLKVIVDRDDLEPLHLRKSRFVQVKPGEWVSTKPKKTNKATIMMVGDMMCTGAQQAVQGYDTGDYCFEDSFDYVKPILNSSDMAIGNLETVLSSAWPYMHEEAFIEARPNCNAPARYLEAVKNAGFDAVASGNNHNADAGIRGVIDTVNLIEKYQVAHTGSFASANDPRTMMLDVNGIKIGYLCYVSSLTGYNHKDVDWTQEQRDTYLNYFTYDRAKTDINSLKEAGADYVIVYMHWGIKNILSIKPSMETTAQLLANLGADYIVGSHSHLLQPYKTYVSKDGKTVPCFFSMGDFQASVDQITGNRDSVILTVDLEKDADGNVKITREGYIPCFTLTEYEGKHFPTLPVDMEVKDKDVKKQLDQAKDRIKRYVGDLISPIKYNK